MRDTEVAYIIWDLDQGNVAFPGPLQTRNSAELHIERIVRSFPGVDTGDRFAVVEVPISK